MIMMYQYYHELQPYMDQIAPYVSIPMPRSIHELRVAVSMMRQIRPYWSSQILPYMHIIGKKHTFKKYDQFDPNTSCFWGIVQFHEIFVTKIMNKIIYYCC